VSDLDGIEYTGATAWEISQWTNGAIMYVNGRPVIDTREGPVVIEIGDWVVQVDDAYEVRGPDEVTVADFVRKRHCKYCGFQWTTRNPWCPRCPRGRNPCNARWASAG
jgi:hypothetical protein